ncbi:S-adenosyl-L-methionine-dependent methyltransferase [Pterulicium gracile]|uniref:S-adenosyl-L-methionine-dependent methyltransferase n=1 Tax=Pterulicium gracile TaxID=1884261 RepID=A0A5C3QJZ8_9AGAR|nr:S-adenosyl-L-methionine-dependent methyltransferase [Pterula gracilis]
MNFYFEAAKVLDQLDAKKGSIKGIIGTLPEKDRKRTAALVIETLKFKPALSTIIKEAQLMKEERKKITSLNLALALVHDLLLAKGIQAGDGPIKQAVLRHKTRLSAELTKLKIKKGAKSTVDLAQAEDARVAQIPRYVRVNTALWSTDDAVSWYSSHGYTLSAPLLSERGFDKDEHIPDLLRFHPRVTFHEDECYKRGKIILQDKASCFPAVVLNPPVSEHAVVIDATAAPGNKTSHLSALMQGKGKLFAFERDRKRYQTLTRMLSKAGCKNVTPLNIDFLTIDPESEPYSAATHILLDPSCSGSGIVNRLDYLLDTEENDLQGEDDRLSKLAAFQLMMINHAMKFPRVQCIVYSTCSIHATENEHVVREALSGNPHFGMAPPEGVLSSWTRRGIPEECACPEHAQSMLRCMPGEDFTNGFFVSCFAKAAEPTAIEEPATTATASKRPREDDDGDAATKEAPKPSKKSKKKRKKKHQ